MSGTRINAKFVESLRVRLLGALGDRLEAKRTRYQRSCLWLADRLTSVVNWLLGQAYPAWRGK